MAPTFVQSGNSPISPTAGVTSVIVTFPVATTAQNLIVLAMGGDKNCGALTSIPSGFTAEIVQLQASVSMYVVWGVSSGQTTFTLGWTTTASSGNYAWGGEYSDAGLNPWGLVAKATNPNTDDLNYTSWASGTITNVPASGICLAPFAVDSGGSPAQNPTFSNSFTAREVQSTAVRGTLGAGWIFVGEKDATVGDTLTTTLSYTSAADQWHGAILVLARESVPEAGTTTAVVRNPNRLG